MADDGVRLVWMSSDYAIIETGAQLEFSRRAFSSLWIRIPSWLFFGGATVGHLFGDRPLLALLAAPFLVLLFRRPRGDRAGVGVVTPLATIDRRLGVVSLAGPPVARLDEVEASVVHDAGVDTHAIELHGPDFRVRVVELPASASEHLVAELRGLGVPMRGDVASYRTADVGMSAV